MSSSMSNTGGPSAPGQPRAEGPERISPPGLPAAGAPGGSSKLARQFKRARAADPHLATWMRANYDKLHAELGAGQRIRWRELLEVAGTARRRRRARARRRTRPTALARHSRAHLAAHAP